MISSCYNQRIKPWTTLRGRGRRVNEGGRERNREGFSDGREILFAIALGNPVWTYLSDAGKGFCTDYHHKLLPHDSCHNAPWSANQNARAKHVSAKSVGYSMVEVKNKVKLSSASSNAFERSSHSDDKRSLGIKQNLIRNTFKPQFFKQDFRNMFWEMFC